MLNVTSWQHWIAVSEVDYCDGLIYINLDDKTYDMTKRYYVTGNFSKYIPYGASRVEAVCEDNELKVLAFVKEGMTIIVAINDTDKEKTVSVDAEEVKLVVTDKDNDLAESAVNGENIRLAAKSVSTIIF